ncbi:MAG: hypothetical protein E6K98_05585 [Thaumarchaeota archaeon]|nr:MAG: hypothetical protein E6K98_05585 [Nitrososphaerota archaeon]TLX94962.1 MAG: hypothetical protein E6K91_04670 [Nitrososphaerota archaeon]
MTLQKKIDSYTAEEIARTFLAQYHSVFGTKTRFEDGIWLVEAKTLSSSGASVKKVRIESKTGRIIKVE